MSALIIDVRTPAEFAARHVQGALNLSFEDPTFVSQVRALPKDQEYIVYCNAGGRAGRSARQMRQLGFLDVTALGILQASAASGSPIVYHD
ncbi:MAG: rhodanese-like domain-containing protein [Propionibacteriaceae bacterium]|jgi:rhodanese-related sulfurtransferase|nr:rhodanese-like domain-containing protein [Propionibacteriaceae bacterium]